jgi:hypothetical protein
VPLDQSEYVDLPQRLITEVEPIRVSRIVGHVDDFDGVALPSFLEVFLVGHLNVAC